VISVLVVDDDFRVADVHRGFVEQCDGFEIAGVALSAAQAIELNQELLPDLVLLDLYLPDAHGLEITARLRSDSAADIIVITAARDIKNIKSAMQHGALHYLIKPFQFATFRERLEKYRDYRESLDASSGMSQDAVDNIFASLRTQPTHLPKGLSADTLYVVEQTLLEANREMTSEEVAHLSGVSRVTARRYLRYLVDAGRSIATSEYGSPGRPKHLYSSVRAPKPDQ
jgi:two-component system CitB family response regulator